MQYPLFKYSSPALIFALVACGDPAEQVDSGEPAPVEQAVAPQPAVPQPAAEPTPITDQAPADEPADELRPMGTFELTYYWMAEAKDEGKATTTLYHRKGCKEIAKVSPSFARRLTVEGTGKLRDGRVVNTSGTCACPTSICFFTPSKRKRWGVGVGKKPLAPFRTVAVDPKAVPIGTMMYIPELDGLTMPGRRPWGGFVHDGCVIARDRGGNVQGKQLDFFMGKRHAYRSFFRRHRLKSVSVFDGTGRCEPDRRSAVKANRNSI
jgi:3D (Asp-Asp-Asp) domain-containing protein